ncbi:FAD-dependent oxidoreductase [Mucilaginibacter sp. L3T2-6]|uniref:FAD-dependent oxidoreductase n=1 Tax=Mucilaginibacter sp. L3T2-6 TaxID=3062491 RepID=UPI002675D56C|nr:FAD-dependent oxidoreductase [Mucilaginibacter sp. L3T2-6]MDO3642659.1 FAD-dependent oxidoreductase [Mucilaginibacter sp. L3T2-6]MDV6217781.1 FAD-dependent oxidoreductase [Mucilaginibacter sp. L3T2-6]
MSLNKYPLKKRTAKYLLIKEIGLKFIFTLIIVIISCRKTHIIKLENTGSGLDTLQQLPSNAIKTDVVIYGATSSGVIAAIEAARLGKNVILIATDQYIGGMTTGGLCKTDIVDSGVNIGGLTHDFYLKVAAKYAERVPSYTFEPKIALQVFNEFLNSYPNIQIFRNERLSLKNSVIKDAESKRIVMITMESGKIFGAKEYIDASYEGDLLAHAGVSYTVGREDNSKYNESYNGARLPIIFPVKVSPYFTDSDPSSGLLQRVNGSAISAPGTGDNKIMAYNYRICLTNDPTDTISITKPDNLNMKDFEIMFRMLKQQYNVFLGWHKIKNNKLDVNSANYFSTDYVGINSLYPEATYDERDSIKRRIENYDRGLIWLIQNDPRISPKIQKFYKNFGLPKDEFVQNNGWPTQLYVREARRMISEYVITDNYILNKGHVNDPIALGTYPMDSHLIQYGIAVPGRLEGEGQMFIDRNRAYGISFRALVPRQSECTNLAVSICVSASHSAFCSLRTEPTYMVMGQSAAAAAVLAINQKCKIQNVDYIKLRDQLISEHQYLQPNQGN